MSSNVLCAVILLVCALTFSAAQESCKGRCGGEFYRGSTCQCDYNCLSYGECCKDFESQCTTKTSCKGRCGEGFKRGRLCSCDSDCSNYKQCCSDHKLHCDAKEPTLNEATEPPTFSEGNNADMSSQPFPNDEFTNNEVEDPEKNPIPESTSGYGWSTADPQDHISTEPIQDPDTLETVAIDPTSSSNPGTTLPQPTAAADHVSSWPTSTSVPQTKYSPTANTPELETTGQAELADDNLSVDPTAVPSVEPEVTTKTASTGPTKGSSTVLENSQVTTIPEATTPNKPDDTDNNAGRVTTGPPSSLADLEDPPTSVSPDGNGDLPEWDALTTHIPSSTDAVQHHTTEKVTPGITTAHLLNVTPDPTKPAPDATKPAPDATKPSPDPTKLAPGATKPAPDPTKPAPDLNKPEPDPTKPAPDPAKPATDPTNPAPDPTKPAPSKVPSKPRDQPDPYKPSPAKPTLVKPSSKPNTKPLEPAHTLNTDNPRDYQADDSNDTNLCSGRPIGAVTTLSNGTMVVFRGHYFWILNKYMVPGPARGITQVWGVPSPIDTAFTRCNCQGKTYIFKGSQYWRFQNDVLDGNYPKSIATGFDGLQGQITAALSVPQYQRRRESVYFFKRGGLVQKYSYQFGTSSTCGRQVQRPVYTVRTRKVRQAVSVLGAVVNIKTSWRGFPSAITAAVSIPSITEPERYKYYVLSRSKSYNVRMDSGHPVIPAPTDNESPQSNNFLKCSARV